ENWKLSPEQLERLQNGNNARLEVWDGHPMVITTNLPPTCKKRKYSFVAYGYKDEMELAKQSRNALLAVRAELHRLHFLTKDKNAPIRLGNAVFKSLGFTHCSKNRALKILEKGRWVAVEWNKTKSPLVTLLRGFYFKF